MWVGGGSGVSVGGWKEWGLSLGGWREWGVSVGRWREWGECGWVEGVGSECGWVEGVGCECGWVEGVWYCGTLHCLCSMHAGAIALAEVLAESRVLEHIDVRDNDVRIAGLMALSLAHRLNHHILHLGVPKNIKCDPVCGEEGVGMIKLVSPQPTGHRSCCHLLAHPTNGVHVAKCWLAVCVCVCVCVHVCACVRTLLLCAAYSLHFAAGQRGGG